MSVWHLSRALLLLALCASSQAWGQYNLRTAPTSPAAGASFNVSFDDDDCEIFFLGEPGAPPSVVVNGSIVRIEVDRAPVIDCTSAELTYTVPVSSLPAGDYTLQLIGRVFGSPGTEGLLQSVPLQVVAGAPPAPFTIPALDTWGLVVLSGLCAFLAGVATRRHR